MITSLLRRRAMMQKPAGQDQPLPVFPDIPSDYQRIAYIETLGGVYYIADNFYLSGNYMTLYVKPTNNTKVDWFFDSGVSAFTKRIQLAEDTYAVQNYTEIIYTIGPAYNTFYCKNGSGYASDTRKPQILSSAATGRFYGIDWLKSGVHYFVIPCTRVTDGAIGLYHTRSGHFYENQGTGTPTAGPII